MVVRLQYLSICSRLGRICLLMVPTLFVIPATEGHEPERRKFQRHVHRSHNHSRQVSSHHLHHPLLHRHLIFLPIPDTPFYLRGYGYHLSGYPYGPFGYASYYGFRYPYPYYRYPVPPRLPTFGSRGRSEPPPRAALPSMGGSTVEHDGWKLLAEGDAAGAIDVFFKKMENEPAYGGWKIGHALSVGTGDDLYYAVSTMRNACRDNTASVQIFDLTEQLRPTVAQLIQRYRKEQAGSRRNPDASFMLAALYYIQRDSKAAQAVINRAIREGDNSESARNLKRIIERLSSRAQTDQAAAPQVP